MTCIGHSERSAAAYCPKWKQFLRSPIPASQRLASQVRETQAYGLRHIVVIARLRIVRRERLDLIDPPTLPFDAAFATTAVHGGKLLIRTHNCQSKVRST
jgi:hypothetical protein